MKLFLKRIIWRFPTLRMTLVQLINLLNGDKRRFNKKLEDLLKGKRYNFIQIGSNDGVTNDPLYKYATLNDWKGVVEPAPLSFKKLEANYSGCPNIKPLNAICAKSDMVDFFYVSEKALADLKYLPVWWDQLGSFDRSHILKHLDGYFKDHITSKKIRAITLNEIISQYLNAPLDLLHIDAEGFDDIVLDTMDLSVYQPKIIILEHKHLQDTNKNKLLKKLESFGYKIEFFHDDLVCVCD